MVPLSSSGTTATAALLLVVLVLGTVLALALTLALTLTLAIFVSSCFLFLTMTTTNAISPRAVPQSSTAKRNAVVDTIAAPAEDGDKLRTLVVMSTRLLIVAWIGLTNNRRRGII